MTTKPLGPSLFTQAIDPVIDVGGSFLTDRELMRLSRTCSDAYQKVVSNDLEWGKRAQAKKIPIKNPSPLSVFAQYAKAHHLEFRMKKAFEEGSQAGDRILQWIMNRSAIHLDEMIPFDPNGAATLLLMEGGPFLLAGITLLSFPESSTDFTMYALARLIPAFGGSLTISSMIIYTRNSGLISAICGKLFSAKVQLSTYVQRALNVSKN